MSEEHKTGTYQRRPAQYFVILVDGEIVVFNGRVALNRYLEKIDPDKIKKIIRGHEAELAVKKYLAIQI